MTKQLSLDVEQRTKRQALEHEPNHGDIDKSDRRGGFAFIIELFLNTTTAVKGIVKKGGQIADAKTASESVAPVSVSPVATETKPGSRQTNRSAKAGRWRVSDVLRASLGVRVKAHPPFSC